MAKARPAGDKLDATGIDTVCEKIAEGLSLLDIAREIGVSQASLIAWIYANPERSARARVIRSLMAQHWDEKAERVIVDACDPVEVSKARELAHHYRWRASKVDPKGYGDQMKVEHSGSIDLASALEEARKRRRDGDA